MSEVANASPKPIASRRDEVARYVPAIILALVVYLGSQEDEATRLFMAVLGGFLLQGVLSFGYIAAFHITGAVAERVEPTPDSRSQAWTAALVLAAAAMLFGQYQINQRERAIEQCLRADLASRPGHPYGLLPVEAIRSCTVGDSKR